LTHWIETHRAGDEVHQLTYRDLPIELQVDFPERVGLDRLAAVVAANALRNPSHAAIVVTSGTAVTVNLITSDGIFAGGAILPGFRMQAEALFGADQLPLTALASDEAPPPLGKNTDQAIQSGLFWGTVGAVRELIIRLSETMDSPVDVFVTGGDVRRLATVLGPNVQFVPNLVLAGIRYAS
jgi:type III pantothenate kinase